MDDMTVRDDALIHAPGTETEPHRRYSSFLSNLLSGPSSSDALVSLARTKGPTSSSTDPGILSDDTLQLQSPPASAKILRHREAGVQLNASFKSNNTDSPKIAQDVEQQPSEQAQTQHAKSVSVSGDAGVPTAKASTAASLGHEAVRK